MKNRFRFLMVLVLFLGMSSLLVPTIAQEDGGTIILGVSAPAGTFTGSHYYCRAPFSFCPKHRFVYIELIEVDPELGWYTPDQPGALAESWEFSEGNRVITVHLRDDLYWSDSVPITSADVMMNFELAWRPESNRFGEGGVKQLSSVFEKIEAPDEHTVVFTSVQADCDILENINYGAVLPAHIYRELIAEVGYAELRNHEWFQNPAIASGPFIFDELADDGSITLIRNEIYTDTPPGYVRPESFVQLTVGEDKDAVDMFWTGEINVLEDVPVERRSEFVAAAEAGEVQIYQYPDDIITFMAMNRADPTNPQPALDENGNRIDQGLHPVFGDKLTRQAIARAIDVDTLIDEALSGFGARLPAHLIPGSWAFNHNLPPIPYDPETALTMLVEAGWLPENPDLPASPDNKLICQDCLYAREIDPAFNGSYLEFELLTREDNDARLIASQLIQTQLAQIGITVDLQVIEWDMLLERTLGQTYDAVMLGFTFGYPHSPSNLISQFSAGGDTPGSGYNWSSFYNEGYYALEETASNIPGCGLTERAEIYHRMQEIMQDELPYVFLYTIEGMYAARNEVEGFNPYPNDLWWNVETWVVHEDD